jgi:type I restriction enzyme S subunit
VNSIMLQHVPKDWRIERLGQLFSERKEKVSDEEFEPLSVTKNGIVPQMEHVAKSDDSGNRKKVCMGDFVINSRSDRKGSSGLSDYDGSVSLISIVLEPRHGYPRFLHHLMKSYAFQEEFYRFGHGIVADLWTTRFLEMKGIQVGLPDLPSQQAIGDFLDRETARIDQLIDKKERQDFTLEEEHQAFVTMAVTTGLQPAPMSLTGNSWLKEIPGYWDLSRLKFACARIVDCLHETPEHSEGGDYPSIRTADVVRGHLLLNQAKRVSEDEYRTRIQRLEPAEGDILYTREGERFGLAALVPPGVNLCLGQRMMMFRTNRRVLPAFLMWSLNGQFAYNWLKQSTSGATSPHLNIYDIRNLPLPLPPLAEQPNLGLRPPGLQLMSLRGPWDPTLLPGGWRASTLGG